jgi:hypothetical protein
MESIYIKFIIKLLFIKKNFRLSEKFNSLYNEKEIINSWIKILKSL